jgi:hypothetical protein
LTLSSTSTGLTALADRADLRGANLVGALLPKTLKPGRPAGAFTIPTVNRDPGSCLAKKAYWSPWNASAITTKAKATKPFTSSDSAGLTRLRHITLVVAHSSQDKKTTKDEFTGYSHNPVSLFIGLARSCREANW